MVPALLCVCLPGDDEDFRLEVEAAVDAAGPDAHITPNGLAGVIRLLQLSYPAAGVQPVVLAEPSGGARQVWWYVHRDGRPALIM